jgi:spermidine/putrescine transport system ATP-binding protein
MSSFLQLTDITKAYGDVEAVCGVDLNIEEGEFLTLLGPSGCGKSTLLRIIGGFEEPNRGKVEFRGNDLRRVPPERRPFNMVFQSYALFPHMTVSENVAYGPRIAGESGQALQSRVDAMLELVHLGPLAKRRVKEMSGGQQQRVALARALINKPEVLLLDEPLGALDLQLRKRLQDQLRSIQREVGTSFVYVTHDQEEALSLSHRIAVVDGGLIVQIGEPRDIYEEPATEFVAHFIGDTNLVGCTVRHEHGAEVDVEFVGGSSLTLRHHGSVPLREQEPALAVLRPHHLELCDPGEGILTGTIKQTVFLGTHSRHELELEHGGTLRVNSSPGDGVLDGAPRGVRVNPGHGAVVRRESDRGRNGAGAPTTASFAPAPSAGG